MRLVNANARWKARGKRMDSRMYRPACHTEATLEVVSILTMNAYLSSKNYLKKRCGEARTGEVWGARHASGGEILVL